MRLVCVARDRRAAEVAEAEGVVKLFDAGIHESAVVRHRRGDGVQGPLARELVVHRHVQRRGFDVEQIVLAGQIADGLDLRRPDVPAPLRLEIRQICFDVAAQRPGVLVAELHLEREAVRLDAHGMSPGACRGAGSRKASDPARAACRRSDRLRRAPAAGQQASAQQHASANIGTAFIGSPCVVLLHEMYQRTAAASISGCGTSCVRR